ncbi:phospholipid carrier-dependent glycosyltransferase, partial [Streptomyces sp. NPDC048551]
MTSTATPPPSPAGAPPVPTGAGDSAPEPSAWLRRLRGFGYAPAGPAGDVRTRLVPPYAQPSEQLWTALGAPPPPTPHTAP